jgi:hypothetical protein
MEDRKNPETSCRDPVGRQPHPVELGQQPEASLAWSSKMPVTKRRQRRCRAMLLNPEIAVAGAHVVSPSGGRVVASKGPDADGPTGVAGTWRTSTGVPQVHESLWSLRPWNRFRWHRTQSPWPTITHSGSEGAKHAVQRAVSSCELNELGEMDDQYSECLHSTANRSKRSRDRIDRPKEAN